MELTVRGKQIDVGDALRGHVDDHLGGMVAKYFERSIDASVVFSREAHLFRSHIQVHVGRGVNVQGIAEAEAPYAAFDQAAEKIEKQHRRHKRRLKDHHKRSDAGEPTAAQQYSLAAPDEDAETAPPQQGNGEDHDHPPIVIAEMETEILTLSVGEAVMRLDFSDVPALMFRNRSHGGMNMVYRRDDGNIGWIDPQGTAG